MSEHDSDDEDGERSALVSPWRSDDGGSTTDDETSSDDNGEKEEDRDNLNDKTALDSESTDTTPTSEVSDQHTFDDSLCDSVDGDEVTDKDAASEGESEDNSEYSTISSLSWYLDYVQSEKSTTINRYLIRILLSESFEFIVSSLSCG